MKKIFLFALLMLFLASCAKPEENTRHSYLIEDWNILDTVIDF